MTAYRDRHLALEAEAKKAAKKEQPPAKRQSASAKRKSSDKA